jgi:hypothetical protein
MQVRIADTFTDSLIRLSKGEQRAAILAAFDLELNPAHPGLKLHKLDLARDKRIWSVRALRDISRIRYGDLGDKVPALQYRTTLPVGCAHPRQSPLFGHRHSSCFRVSPRPGGSVSGRKTGNLRDGCRVRNGGHRRLQHADDGCNRYICPNAASPVMAIGTSAAARRFRRVWVVGAGATLLLLNPTIRELEISLQEEL